MPYVMIYHEILDFLFTTQRRLFNYKMQQFRTNLGVETGVVVLFILLIYSFIYHPSEQTNNGVVNPTLLPL